MGINLWFRGKKTVKQPKNQIRVMTIHGAKGLESPIVILPETQKRKVEVRDKILTSDKIAVWNSKRGQATYNEEEIKSKKYGHWKKNGTGCSMLQSPEPKLGSWQCLPVSWTINAGMRK